MITFITGRPGSGKTLYAVTLGMQYVMEGRPVYALDINGLNYDATGIKPYPHGALSNWQQLEPNAVLIVDEVQSMLKPRGNSAPVPDWIEAFTRNRHKGVDLIFITQDPMLVDPYVRRVANYHEHLVRPEGDPAMARKWRWSGLHDDVGKKGAPSLNSEFSLWRYPAQNYALYKSAELHTVKFRLPQSLRFLIFGGALAVIVAAVSVWALLQLGAPPDSSDVASGAAKEAPQVPPPPPPSSSKSGMGPFDFGVSSTDGATMTRRDYVLRLIPRVDGMPVSAPIYDGISPSSVPEIYCMSSPDSCTCLSEQGTKIRVADAVCRTIAREGSYNPFRRSSNVGVGRRS